MHAAGSRAGPIVHAACIVTGYCLDISESASFTAVWSKYLIVYDSKFAYVQILTGNIERSLSRSLSEKDVNYNRFVKKKCLFSTRALLEESPPGPCLRPWIAIKIWLNFVSKGSINNAPALFQIMAWCRSATSHYLIEWWPSSLTHISIAGNKRIIIYGECCYAMQRHRFTMNYQKARYNT